MTAADAPIAEGLLLVSEGAVVFLFSTSRAQTGCASSDALTLLDS